MPRQPLTRGPLGLIVVAVALVVLAAGCGGGPGEDQMLPVKSLVYPGAVEDRRAFDDAVDARSVDGNPVKSPAQLRIYYRPDGDLDIDAVRGWYRDRLTEDGWTTTDFDVTEQDVMLETIRDGSWHRYIVESESSANEFVVRYQIKPA